MKTNETKLFNSKIKSLFAKTSVPPQSQNLTKAGCKKPKTSPLIKTTSLVTKPSIVEAPSTAKKLTGVSENSPPNLEKVSRDDPALKPATTGRDPTNPGSLNAKEEILIQASSAEFVSTMCHEKLNSVIESLNLDLPKATTKNIKSLTKSYIESADYQQRLLLTPFESLIFCFNDNSEFICMFHELSEANHDIVLQQEKHETYLSNGKFTFLDQKRIIFHSLLSRENFNIELPWVGLTHAQKQSVTRMCLSKDSLETSARTELLSQEESMLLKTLKLSAQLSHITKRKPENNLIFEFSITDPLQLKVWEVKKSDNLRKYTSSLNELFGIKNSAQLDIVKAKENTVSDVKDITNLDPKEKGGKSTVEKICSNSKKNGQKMHTLVEGDMGSSESAKQTLTSTPKPQRIVNDNQLKFDQVATKQPNLLKEACKTCSKQYGNNSALECFVCKNKVHYVCYKGTNGNELSHEHFKLIKENIPNLKWFCNKCNATSIEALTSTLTDSKSWVQSEKENSTEDPNKDDDSPFHKRNHDGYDKITQASEAQYAPFETLDHVSATDHTRGCLSDTPKRSYNLIGDIGPMSPITEADEEKQDELEFNVSNPNGGNSQIMHKIDLLLNQRKKDSKVISEILKSLKSPDRGTDDSYCGRLTSPRPHAHGPTYGIPEKPVKTTVKPTRTLVVSKDISRSLSKGSSEIKKEFNKLYRDVPIEHCFASKGGSIFIELASEEEATRVVNSWKTSFFADSNRGPRDGTVCKLLSSIQNSVIVKAVPTEFKEDFIQDCIQENYPGAQVKRFVKAGKVELRTIKIDLTTPEQSEKMIERGLFIHNLSLRAEKYIPRQRVIQCYHCYKFGHVAKFCHQKKPTCPLCAQNHYPEECDQTTQLCCNCASPSHYATSKNCPKFKTVLERIKNSNETSHQYEIQNNPINLGHDF